MGKRVIASLEDIEGEAVEGKIVTVFGEPYWVINANYYDDKGPGVELEMMYDEKIINFLWEKIARNTK